MSPAKPVAARQTLRRIGIVYIRLWAGGTSAPADAYSRFAAAFQIVLLAEHEHDHVGVLFDGARFTKIGQLRALVFALFDLAGELREGKNGYVELFGKGFEPRRNLSHFLHAAFGGAPRGAG